MIYNINIGSQLLGCIFKNPSLIMNPQFPLQPDDFAPEQFHKILFLCASKAYQAGINDITEIETRTICFPISMSFLHCRAKFSINSMF